MKAISAMSSWKTGAMQFVGLLSILGTIAVVSAAPDGDLVTSLPGFPEQHPFKVYSGYLDVPGPVAGYSSLHIHYQFHTSQKTPSQDPVVTWHQGGPGGSSLYGQYGEMGYFNVAMDTNGSLTYHVNPNAWNNVANMLYLESPAGSNDPIGFSWCEIDGKIPNVCHWNDTSQAEAYAHTLKAFYAAFPEFSSNDLYISGESYAGQYVPNIAHYIVTQMETEIPLKGILVGNGCWGGDAHSVECNGPNSDQNDLDILFGKGLISKPAYEKAYEACKFPITGRPGLECDMALELAENEVGSYNIYDIYDDCPRTREWLKQSGKSMRWLKRFLRSRNGHQLAETDNVLNKMVGGNEDGSAGYNWLCGGLPGLANYMSQSAVQTSLHLSSPPRIQFSYDTSGPASVTLYPSLAQKIRVLIYNGDSDMCVPYKGNEEFVEGFTKSGILKTKKSWHPWTEPNVNGGIPLGYATSYDVVGSNEMDFTFVTVRLAGHMVPQYQPGPALAFFKRFIAKTPF